MSIGEHTVRDKEGTHRVCADVLHLATALHHLPDLERGLELPDVPHQDDAILVAAGDEVPTTASRQLARH